MVLSCVLFIRAMPPAAGSSGFAEDVEFQPLVALHAVDAETLRSRIGDTKRLVDLEGVLDLPHSRFRARSAHGLRTVSLVRIVLNWKYL